MAPTRNLALFGFMAALQIAALIGLCRSLEGVFSTFLALEGLIGSGLSLLFGLVAINGAQTPKIIAVVVSIVGGAAILPINLFVGFLSLIDKPAGGLFLWMTVAYSASLVVSAALLALCRSNSSRGQTADKNRRPQA
jgi:hypothetical protein